MIARAVKHGYHVIDATKELALDALARKNRAKPPALSLALPTLQGVLAQVELGGDGTTAPAGTVAVLAPSAKPEPRDVSAPRDASVRAHGRLVRVADNRRRR